MFYPTIFKSPLTLNYIPWSKVPKDTVHVVALPAMGFHGPLRKRNEGLRLLRLISGKVWIDFIEKPTMPDYFKHYSAVQLITDAWSPTGCNWRSALAAKLHGCGQNSPNDESIHTDVRLAAATCWIKLRQLMMKPNGRWQSNIQGMKMQMELSYIRKTVPWLACNILEFNYSCAVELRLF